MNNETKLIAFSASTSGSAENCRAKCRYSCYHPISSKIYEFCGIRASTLGFALVLFNKYHAMLPTGPISC